MEGDFFFVPETKVVKDFNPLPPHGGRRSLRSILERRQKNFNPLPPHGGRRFYKRTLRNMKNISIHSLRMEGDD